MRQAIRVYAIVALVALAGLWAIQTAWWASTDTVTGATIWGEALDLVMEAQLWALLVMPLGVLAASDAARAGRRRWLVAFIALMAVAPFAANLEALASSIPILLNPACALSGACPSGGGLPSQFLIPVGWAAAFLLVPLAALLYTFMPGQREAGAPLVSPDASQGERRTLIISASVGIVVMSALSYLVNSQILIMQFGAGSFEHFMVAIQLRELMRGLWFTLAALPVAVASLALAHAARAGRRGWLAGWIALATLSLLSANIFVTAFIASAIGAPAWLGASAVQPDGVITWQQQLNIVSVVAPGVVMLVALIYALTVMRPQQRAAALAIA